MKKTTANSVAAVAASLALSAFAADMRIDLKGDIDAEQAVATEVVPVLYFQATRRPSGLADELRVYDGDGKAVPYVVRQSMVRVVSAEREWRLLSMVSAAETNGELVVEAEWPDGVPAPDTILSLKVSTPLTDFDERVAVLGDDAPIAEGEIYDRRKFADVRKDELPINASFRRRLKLVFSKPVSDVAAKDYEKTTAEDAAGAAVGATTRRKFSERAFRVDSVSVSVPKEVVSFEPESPWEMRLCDTPHFDAKAKKTYIDFDAAYMPVCGFSLNVKDRNFSRTVRLLARANAGWRQLASGKISSIELPGEKSSSLSLKLPGEIREGVLRIEVDDMDNPQLEYSDHPMTLLVKRYDAVFIAKPGEKYSLAVEKGAERPRYDSQILDYLLKTRNLSRLHAEGARDCGTLESHEPAAVWMWNPVAIASTVAFIVLAALAFLLFRTSGGSAGRS